MSSGYGKSDLAALHCLVEHVHVHEAGEHVFRRGEPFRALYAVRRGAVKTSLFGSSGRFSTRTSAGTCERTSR